MYDPGTLQEKLFAEHVWQSMIHGQFAGKAFCRACVAEYDPGSLQENLSAEHRAF